MYTTTINPIETPIPIIEMVYCTTWDLFLWHFFQKSDGKMFFTTSTGQQTDPLPTFIQSDPENRYLKQGKVCILTDEQTEENQRNQEQGISSCIGGYVVNWEDVELIGEQKC